MPTPTPNQPENPGLYFIDYVKNHTNMQLKCLCNEFMFRNFSSDDDYAKYFEEPENNLVQIKGTDFYFTLFENELSLTHKAFLGLKMKIKKDHGHSLTSSLGEHICYFEAMIARDIEQINASAKSQIALHEWNTEYTSCKDLPTKGIPV